VKNLNSVNDAIDLTSIAYVTGASATRSASVLTLSDGGATYKFNLGGTLASSYEVLSDGASGTLIVDTPSRPGDVHSNGSNGAADDWLLGGSDGGVWRRALLSRLAPLAQAMASFAPSEAVAFDTAGHSSHTSASLPALGTADVKVHSAFT
jgi:hypothetical protein